MAKEMFNETDIAMIQGCQQTIQIDIYNILSEVCNIAIDKVEWRMSRYGETECLVSKNSIDNEDEVSIDINVLTITILSSDTMDMDLSGKFTHQAIITDLSGKQFVLDLGKISIKPMIK